MQLKQLHFDYCRMKWLEDIYFKEKLDLRRGDVREIEQWLKTDTNVPDTLEGNLVTNCKLIQKEGTLVANGMDNILWCLYQLIWSAFHRETCALVSILMSVCPQ